MPRRGGARAGDGLTGEAVGERGDGGRPAAGRSSRAADAGDTPQEPSAAASSRGGRRRASIEAVGGSAESGRRRQQVSGRLETAERRPRRRRTRLVWATDDGDDAAHARGGSSSTARGHRTRSRPVMRSRQSTGRLGDGPTRPQCPDPRSARAGPRRRLDQPVGHARRWPPRLASTITRTSGSVPLGRTSTRPASPSSASTRPRSRRPRRTRRGPLGARRPAR